MAQDRAQDLLHKKQLTYDEPITERALYDMSKASGSDENIEPPGERTVLKGHFNCDRFVNAIDLHSSDTVEVENMVVEAHLQPALTVCVLLEGHVDWSMDGEDFVLDAASGPRGFLWAYGKPVCWRRKVTAGTRIRKINVSVEGEWIKALLREAGEAGSTVANLFEDPFQVHEWQLSKRVITLTNQIIAANNDNPLIHYLRRESRALEILGEALECIDGVGSHDIRGKAHGQQMSRAESIREYIEHGNLGEMTLPLISQELGFSISNMQSCFKHVYGMTIMDYIRERRLLTARTALEREGLSIAQAAFLAGYTSPANFSTAFKRRFGISPSDVKLG
ncbi:MAG: helix-turn-helix transcriptional regulator [Sneathiella sp.]|nr:helix-turn-helix transcriptional regulator [Sneathiella sp.]